MAEQVETRVNTHRVAAWDPVLPAENDKPATSRVQAAAGGAFQSTRPGRENAPSTVQTASVVGQKQGLTVSLLSESPSVT